MPDRGDERGRGGTRTLVTGILAGTEWHPATNPQEATQTAREARDLAVRLRPVLSKLAQAPRGGRRRDLEWLPAVEQLAVDAQYFASWWLPRLEGKSAQSWPSWSADGYADWVKRLDAQRLRTLEMVEGTAPVTRIASVTQLRRGKGAAAEAEAGAALQAGPTVEPHTEPHTELHAEVAQTPVSGIGEAADAHSPGRHAREDSNPAESVKEERSARITPLRGPGAALMDAALMDMAGAGASGVSGAPGMRAEEPDRSLSADETHIARATPVSPGTEDVAASTAPPTPPVPRTPPNQGPVGDDPDTMRVPRTPPNQGPADAGSGVGVGVGVGVGADILQIPRTPPNSSPADAGPPRVQPAPVVSLVGDDDGAPRVPRKPPNSGPGPGPRPRPGAAGNPAAQDDTDATHISLAPAGPKALAPGSDEPTRPLFRPEKPASPPPSVTAPAAAALAGAAIGSGRSGGSGGSGRFGGSGDSDSSDPSDPSDRGEFENFQPGSDLPPPVFPMTEPVEPIDRGRIVWYASAAVVLAAACVLVFVAATHKGSDAKTAASPKSSSSSPAGASSGGSPSSVGPGAVTAPTATDTPGASSTASKPAGPPSPPPSTAPSTSAAANTSAAAPPPPPPSSHPQPQGGGVRSLSVTSLAPDQSGSYTYVAHVHVTTSGTGSVSVMVTFAGTSSASSPGSTGAQSQSFALSGKTSYDLDAQLDVHGMCQSSYIDAVASASGANSAVAFASSPC